MNYFESAFQRSFATDNGKKTLLAACGTFLEFPRILYAFDFQFYMEGYIVLKESLVVTIEFFLN